MNATELNELFAGLKALEMGRTFPAKFAGRDAITGTPFPAGTPIRMLKGMALLSRPICGGDGVEVLSLCERVNGRFVDDVSADGVYYTINARGQALGFKLTGDKVTFAGWKHSARSLAAMRSQKLRHQIALIATDLTEIH